jgi:hypothetical protein
VPVDVKNAKGWTAYDVAIRITWRLDWVPGLAGFMCFFILCHVAPRRLPSALALWVRLAC